MPQRSFLIVIVATIAAIGSAEASAAPLRPDAINAATFVPLPKKSSKMAVPEVVKAEILLDRARFSPGSIDGIDGDNFRKALRAYQARMNLPVSGVLDQATWTALTSRDRAPVVVERSITAQDERGPFVKTIPGAFEKQAALKRLAYRNVQEELAEQYHSSVGLLEALNKGVNWKRAGTVIAVPQVVVDRPGKPSVMRVDVDKLDHAVRAYAADGTLVAFYPASIGSREKPAPSGRFEIRRIAHNPDYTYNPKYAFKGVKTKHPFTIASGPNNPVGSVWLDLSYEGYGIHGTPDPDLVGKTQSHGCIRLTNWDAENLASMVSKGTEVDFLDAPAPEAVASQRGQNAAPVLTTISPPARAMPPHAAPN